MRKCINRGYFLQKKSTKDFPQSFPELYISIQTFRYKTHCRARNVSLSLRRVTNQKHVRAVSFLIRSAPATPWQWTSRVFSGARFYFKCGHYFMCGRIVAMPMWVNRVVLCARSSKKSLVVFTITSQLTYWGSQYATGWVTSCATCSLGHYGINGGGVHASFLKGVQGAFLKTVFTQISRRLAFSHIDAYMYFSFSVCINRSRSSAFSSDNFF